MSLSTKEHGCYMLLLLHYWVNGKLSDDVEELFSITRLPKEEKNILEKILKKYFRREDGYYIQKRAEQEITRAQNIRTRNTRNARRRWDKGTKPVPESCQNGTKPVPESCSSQSQSQSQIQSDKINYVDTDAVIDHFNTVTGQSRRHSKTSRESIHARLTDGFTLTDCQQIIDIKYADWKDDPKMSKHITIETLFRPSNFEKYLNQVRAPTSEPQKKNYREGWDA